jgi:hypothetical protein
MVNILNSLWGHAIGGDLDAIIFNSVAASMLKIVYVRTSELDAKLAEVNVGPWYFVFF